MADALQRSGDTGQGVWVCGCGFVWLCRPGVPGGGMTGARRMGTGSARGSHQFAR